MTPVRVRFAPSPTGELHVGGLRTALFNFLLARQTGGQFILRIEDTDQERFVPGAQEGIVEMLQWAGLDPDEGPHKQGPYGPYKQSERLHLYKAAAEKLIADGHAYRAYDTPEELDEMRKVQVAKGLPPKYDGRHRSLSAEDRAKFEAQGRKAVVRMRMPDRDERIVVSDLVRGKVAFNSKELDDQVLLKSDGFPTYHLAVVVDDNHMRITHVLRAEEWLPSTPKHLYLYKWLGYQVPEYAHLPLLLNDDRSKMSKRKGDVAAEAYRAKGYLPEALVNFLALLGWNPGDDTEVMTLETLIQRFSIERITKAGAVFDREKLNWMNQHYLQQVPIERLYPLLQPHIAETPYAGQDEAMLRKICLAVQPALVTLPDIKKHLALFFRPDGDPLPVEVKQVIAADTAQQVFRALREKVAQQQSITAASFTELVKAVQKDTQVKGKLLWEPLRAALTLATEGPDLKLVVDVLGKDKILARLDQALSGSAAA